MQYVAIMQPLDTLDTLHYSLRGPASGNTSLPDVDSWAYAAPPTPWGSPGRSLGGLLAALLRPLGGRFWASWGLFGASWGLLGPLGGLLGAFGGLLGASCGFLGASRGPAGSLGGPLTAEVSKCHLEFPLLGPSLGCLGRLLHCFGAGE